MKQFLKFTFASVIGTIIGLVITGIIFIVFIAVFVSAMSAEETISVKNNTVLEIKLDFTVQERTTYEPAGNFGLLFPDLVKKPGLRDITENIKKAKKIDEISGIYLNLDNFQGGSYSTIRAIREALIDFKSDGKFVIAHGNRISQKAYYLASVADSVYASPTGELDLRGISLDLMFFKKTLDKLNIETQIFQSGKYKSAVEQFGRENMSPENKEQLNELVGSFNRYIIDQISKDRKIDNGELNNIINDYLSSNLEKALELKLLDGIKYYDELVSIMRSKLGLPEDKPVNKIELIKFLNVPGPSEEYSKDRIAIIYANGEILEGKGDEEYIGLENISAELRKARNNSNIKAVVLRVNSPGGSALTSEQILREVQLTAKEKPVVASFGSVAASGGYYISCAASSIICDPLSITGSIGVFGIIPNLQKFLDDKLGVTFDRIETGKYSSLYSLTKPLNADERKMIEYKIDEVYSTFIKRVTDGREMSTDYVKEIAQGRVWSGLAAKELGLADEVGGLDEAILLAAEKADIEKYRVIEYPAIQEPFEKIMDLLTAEVSINIFGPAEMDVQEIMSNTKQFIFDHGIYTRLPFDLLIN